MGFSIMLNLLKEKEKGKLVFVKLGTFYVATGEDAVLLHNKLGLKCTCFKLNMCKVGFPVNAFEKYVERLNETKYAYVIYDYDSKNVELKEVARKSGKYNKEKEKTINCLLCKGLNNRYEDDKYMLALNKMLEEERERKYNNTE